MAIADEGDEYDDDDRRPVLRQGPLHALEQDGLLARARARERVPRRGNRWGWIDRSVGTTRRNHEFSHFFVCLRGRGQS